MAGRRIRMYTVLPQLPERLSALNKLAKNMWWCWNHDAIHLFRRMDEELFEAVENSPVKLLNAIDQTRIEQLLQDEGFLAQLDRVAEGLDRYLKSPTWYQDNHGKADGIKIAYFSAEFGIHDSIPVYSGGLGVLAGDHLKSASDLGFPLCGVGLMYRQGYMRQYLNQDGWQQERYPENDFFTLPLISENAPDGKPVTVGVPMPGREVKARVWRIQVGRVPLYLLDCNVPQNSAEDREITAQLYGGDQDMRIRQEMVLGIGGYRALKALGITPTVCHMNEGHAAFLSLERIRGMMEEHGMSFDEAREQVTAGNVFTTHTPVPAGNDAFPPAMIENYFAGYLPPLKLDRQSFMALGRQNPSDHGEPFSMTVLALRHANVSNGVSALHGKVSRKMWRTLWPELPDTEIPITSITNGTHIPSWLSLEIAQLYERYLGFRPEKHIDAAVWKRVDNIPDAELWRTHERRRERLVVFARKRLKQQLLKRGAPPGEVNRADEALDPEALTLGFARRFATYKRGNLIFRNLERLTKIVNDKDRPVQIIFAGKAHPRDHGGKQLIAEIVHLARRPELRRRVVFLEDYDMNMARYLTEGVDVWLNNPRRPLEASGTSGMKAAANGVLNLSILDGWWCEGYAQDNGWAIGAGEEYTDLNYQDDVESRAIYDLLEQEIIPQFYVRSTDGVPRGWLRMMKRSLKTLCPMFNTNRMLQEYLKTCYTPSLARFAELAAENMQGARALAKWRTQIHRAWPQVHVESVDANSADSLSVGSDVAVQARIRLGSISPDDVEVQLFHGPVDSLGEIAEPRTITMMRNASLDNGSHVFAGSIPCRTSGHQGFAVRVMPKHAGQANPFASGLICWG